jgi:hypothetical protein
LKVWEKDPPQWNLESADIGAIRRVLENASETLPNIIPGSERRIEKMKGIVSQGVAFDFEPRFRGAAAGDVEKSKTSSIPWRKLKMNY